MDDWSAVDIESEKEREKAKLQLHILWALLIIFVIWTVKIVETLTGYSFSYLGLLPRQPMGLIGILTMPLIHGDFDHLFANSFGLFVSLLLLFHTYERVSWKVVGQIIVLGGLLVWLFARTSYHIGASGLIYGLYAFLFFSGLFRRDKKSMASALVVAMLFGGAVWGVFPFEIGVSWEGHLFGALVGTGSAFFYRNHDRLPVPSDNVAYISPLTSPDLDGTNAVAASPLTHENLVYGDSGFDEFEAELANDWEDAIEDLNDFEDSFDSEDEDAGDSIRIDDSFSDEWDFEADRHRWQRWGRD